RRRPPAALEPAVQQFVRRRPMVPDGDRHHGTQSARLEYRVDPIRNADDDIVVELVLEHHVDELSLGHLDQRPAQHALQRRELPQCPEELFISHPEALHKSASGHQPRIIAYGEALSTTLDDQDDLPVQVAITTLPKWAPLSRYLSPSMA